MTEQADAAEPQSMVQKLVKQLTEPLNKAAETFSSKVGEKLAAQVEEATKAFKQEHPQVQAATDSLIGWASAATNSAGAIGGLSGKARDMIRDNRELRQEITKILDGFPALDGIRLRFMAVGDSIRKMNVASLKSAFSSAADGMRKLNVETVKTTLSTARQAVVTRASTLATKLSAAAARAWAVAQRILNAVLRLNPIGLIITGIMILVGLFVLAYKRSATFRSIVQGAMHGVQVAIGWVVRAAKAVFDWIRGHWKLLLAILTGPIGIAVGLIASHWDAIRRGASAVVSWITRTWNGLVGFFTGLPGRLAGVGARMWNGFRDGARGAVNFLIDAWNRLDFGIHLHLPSWLPGIGGKGIDIDDIIPDIPRLARGGLVPARPGGTLALLGEGREDELVVPLSRVPALGGAAGRPVTVNVYPRAGQSEYEIGRIAARELAWAAKH